MTWGQFISSSAPIKLDPNEYYVKYTGTAQNSNAHSICLYDAFNTPGGYGYGHPWDYMGKICRSTNEYDNVTTSDFIQTNKTYYINRYNSYMWW